ncbi:uncharacterized protein GGS22DRAFT_151583 [Annulohypoxylon maeteangense]|uniref:uncharacterized protein n=1 Tax=Annulohypoxylon maeteangense TaxID=1927788 RepID=UPI002008C347|nr:uncharacterized protein GGS22DRAFT_151583 [Annulohypoxylon maeteangense]KAI0890683.1 hypothetical protein GGS22DRAFT_151583 [Annulohypoxylon maeteangense]
MAIDKCSQLYRCELEALALFLFLDCLPWMIAAPIYTKVQRSTSFRYSFCYVQLIPSDLMALHTSATRHTC